MGNIPGDPVMLMSYLNTQLRDYYGTLDELCAAMGLNKEEICEKLLKAGFEYDEKYGKFL